MEQKKRGRKNLREVRHYKDVRDEEYIGSLEEKLDYEIEETMRYEMQLKESMDDEPPNLWERNL